MTELREKLRKKLKSRINSALNAQNYWCGNKGGITLDDINYPLFHAEKVIVSTLLNISNELLGRDETDKMCEELSIVND